jgi:protein-L-isoaspartate(D-aspartate) O-methyltransferase
LLDSPTHRQLREDLVSSIQAKGITDAAVLNALRSVPRHLFLSPETPALEAYKDKAMEIGMGQTISQPYTVAYQTSLLQPHRGERILEVGTGSGYQAAILSELCDEVYTIERHRKLYIGTKVLLAQLGYTRIRLFYGDGNNGLPEFAPFDKIIVTAASPGIPAKLIDQVRVDGVMVIPVDGNIQKMLRVIKVSPTETKIEEFDDFRFVPLLQGVSH